MSQSGCRHKATNSLDVFERAETKGASDIMFNKKKQFLGQME